MSQRIAASLLVTIVCFAKVSLAAVEDAPQSIGSIDRRDPALDKLVPADAKLEVICTGFEWCEGPVWVRDGGYLLFSDIPNNAVMRWDKEGGCRLHLKPAGFTGEGTRGGELGSNGLAVDRQGRLLLCQHGDRRVARLDARLCEPEAKYITVADRYNGKRFNSPNDLVVSSSGAIYFTDPPYGLMKNIEDPDKELDFQGVYRVGTDGQVTLLTKELERPNGIALSPDGNTLYVANSHMPRPLIMSYSLTKDGTIDEGRVFFDSSPLQLIVQGACDGMTVDRHGNLFATGPGGVMVLTPEGKHLGTLMTEKRTSNCTFGEDGSTLFITADDYLLRVRLKTKGLGF